jgi:hypothetical protein
MGEGERGGGTGGFFRISDYGTQAPVAALQVGVPPLQTVQVAPVSPHAAAVFPV